MINGEQIDVSQLCTLASTSVRLSQRLGIERVSRDVTPSLGAVIRSEPLVGPTRGGSVGTLRPWRALHLSLRRRAIEGEVIRRDGDHSALATTPGGNLGF